MQRIGYLIPEFPGQTHIFFWREMENLRRLGFFPEVVSTRAPHRSVVSHDWAEQAAHTTVYLHPLSSEDWKAVMLILLAAGPKRIWRCMKVSLFENTLSFADRLKTFALIAYGAKLAVIAYRRSWNTVHVHSCANAANVAMFAHILAGVRYGLTLHGYIRDYGTNQANKWRYAGYATIITKRILAEVQRLLAGGLPQKIELAPMGVDIKKFSRLLPYQAPQLRDTIKLFSCGRLNPCKGHDDIIRAVRMLKNEGIRVQLHIAGEDDTGTGAYRAELEKLIRAEAVEDEVKLLGAVSETVVFQSLQDAHIFILASLAEPLGVAIMEAMSLSMPVIATDAGGVPELIDHGKDGVLVPTRHPRAIADAVKSLATHPAKAQALGESARKRVEKEFHSMRSAEVLAGFISSY